MISVNAKYWIMLTLALGYNTPKAKKLCQLYPDISFFFSDLEREGRLCGIFNSQDLDKLRKVREEDAQAIINRCSYLGYSVLTIDDDMYPRCLYNVYSPPALLYISGVLPDLDDLFSIGIVGTRQASHYGVENSYKFGYTLAKCGAVVISGGALGVDCASHTGALAADGVSVCVLGCGINYRYLPENAEMRRAITAKGAVISEYPPDEEPKSFYFPARNRIIAALSNGVLMIEAGRRSGALITANLALEMGRDVFALLGNNNPQNAGSNGRIKEGTAIPVTDYTDILDYYGNLGIDPKDLVFDVPSDIDTQLIPVKGRIYNQPIRQTARAVNTSAAPAPVASRSQPEIQHEKKPEISLTGDEKAVYDVLSNEPVHIDTIAEKLDMSLSRVLSTLTLLEIRGLVRALQGRNFVLK